jgi:ribosomal protein S18 acetylase RimI-like enzyme
MRGGIALREYCAEDWPRVAEIHDAARVQELASGGIDPRAFRSMSEAAEGDEFFASRTTVACDNERVVGFVSWNGDYIAWLYVDPAEQRRGIGTHLLQHALAQIGPQAWTNTVAGNDAALRLYQREGMEVVWTRPFDCEGFPCQGIRLALPTSRMRDPEAKRRR